ncbi:MAG TPA: dephospho-CoA kinase [Acidimicrobiales bacterium]|nr:dephospho-CoA kinase [Acidimicrobiales bacterium]
MLLTAVTGGIGSGKSTVSGGLARRGAPVVDADGVAREIVEPGGAAYDPVRARFGDAVFGPDGRLDRAALAAIVFADRAALAALNAITHPVIAATVLERLAALAAHRGPVVLDIPLLNAGTLELYRPAALVVVDTPTDTAVGRLVAHRGFSEADARARVAAQATRSQRRALLELVEHGRLLDNGGDAAALEAQLDDVWSWLCGLPDRPAGGPCASGGVVTPPR